MLDGAGVLDHAASLEIFRQLLQVGLGSVRDVADEGEQQHGRDVERGQRCEVDEVADRFPGHEVFNTRRAGTVLGIDARHVFRHEVEHLADEDLVGLGVAERLRHEDGRGLAQRSTDDTGGAADGPLGQRQAVEQVVADARSAGCLVGLDSLQAVRTLGVFALFAHGLP